MCPGITGQLNGRLLRPWGEEAASGWKEREQLTGGSERGRAGRKQDARKDGEATTVMSAEDGCLKPRAQPSALRPKLARRGSLENAKYTRWF